MAGSFALFDTPIGQCAIAWTAAGIAGLQLPEANEAALRAAIERKHPGFREATPPPHSASAIAASQRLLAGRAETLSDIPLDLEGIPPFHRAVYAEARRIPPGHTRSYGQIAQALGKTGAARAVGQALGANPYALIVPCHRVLSSNGGLNGFSAHGGVETKRRLLAIESGADRLF